MKYYEIICSNGYCGCDEEFYEKADNLQEIEKIAQEILYNEYGFCEPDERFIDVDPDEEEYDLAYEEYSENLDYDIREITKEEYEKYISY